MRQPIIVANWKMHKTLQEGVAFTQELVQALSRLKAGAACIVLVPPFTHLDAMHKLLPKAGCLYLGAQNCHDQAHGAYTGEIAAAMLQAVGARYVLVGHSERRQYAGEDSTLLAQKLSTALAHGLQPIFCCGEVGPIRTQGASVAFVTQQLQDSLFHLTAAQLSQVIIAYEPVWAIGTGQTPTPNQIQTMHEAIRRTIALQYGVTIAEAIPILYGGSCHAQNVAAFFTCPDVNGVLVGKAALEIKAFIAIIRALAPSTY